MKNLVQQKAAQESQKQQVSEQRAAIMENLCTTEARARLSRISMVKPEQSEKVENLIISMAQSGQLQGKIDENKMKQLLEQVGGGGEAAPAKISFARKNYGDDDSDEEYDL
eukprot:CAMPEP_0175089928 /NCGR_PEP_ID=MMETSP0086_2-20121207/1053_1 /TAXON_ID=136419 /ORGANISM="Unknown Unknown, Strain D1" /LENGTH=110 /DNA_ID=CAMNT_0016362481 /DNA_START=56 /DNA_END=388 /DNA_ORIENTATION=+